MADKKEYADIILEGNTATWEMKEEGDVQGTFTGKFRFRCFLTPTQKIAANREYRELMGDNIVMAPEHESFLAYSLTQLKYRIIDSPPFWQSTLKTSGIAGDLPDENIITIVLNAAVNSELKYKDGIKDKKLEALERAKKAAERMLSQQDDDFEDEVVDEGQS